MPLAFCLFPFSLLVWFLSGSHMQLLGVEQPPWNHEDVAKDARIETQKKPGLQWHHGPSVLVLDSLPVSLLFSEKNKFYLVKSQLELWFLILKQGITMRWDWEGGQKADGEEPWLEGRHHSCYEKYLCYAQGCLCAFGCARVWIYVYLGAGLNVCM